MKKKVNTISSCIIIKNEIDNIPNLLDDLRKFSDEIIVVDTGSTDGTLEYLTEQNDIVLTRFDWIKDFAAARNFSFSQATKDWIFWCDADDRIPDDLVDAILKQKSKLNKGKHNAYYIDYLFGPDIIVPRIRLIKRNTNPTWYGRCHEFLWGDDIKYDDVVFHDKGYILHQRDTGNNPFQNSDRNIKIFIHQLLNNPETMSLRDICYFSNELRDNGYMDKAYLIAKNVFTDPDLPITEGLMLLFNTCNYIWIQNEYFCDEAIETILTFINNYETRNEILRKDVYGLLAFYYNIKGDVDNAKVYAQKAIDTPMHANKESFSYVEYFGEILPNEILNN